MKSDQKNGIMGQTYQLCRQVLEKNFLEKQKEFNARHSVASEEARMKEDSTAAEAAKRRAARAAEIER